MATLGGPSAPNWWAALGAEASPVDRVRAHLMTASLFTGTSLEPVPDLALLPLATPRPEGGGEWVVEQEIAADRRWSDGSPIVASDLVFYLERARELALDGSHVVPQGLVAVEAPDEHTVRVRFDRSPGPALWPGAIGLAPFVPAHHWEPLLRDVGDRLALYGMEFRQPPVARALAVEWVEMETRGEAYRLLAAGEVDLVHDPSGIAGLDQETLELLEESERVSLTTNVRSPLRVLAMNQRGAPFDDPALRIAVAAVVDRVEMSEALGTVPAFSFHDPEAEVPAGPGTFDGERLDLAARLDAAVTLLEEAGYSWATPPGMAGGDPVAGTGLTRPNGSAVGPIQFLVSELDPVRVEAARWIAGRVALLGLEIEVVRMSDLAGIVLPPVSQDRASGWSMALLGWRWTGPADPAGLLIHLFHSSEDSFLRGGTNVTGFTSPVFDDLADRYRATGSPSRASEIAAQMEAVVLQEVAQLPLYRETITEAHAAGLPFAPVIDGIGSDPRSWPYQTP